MRLLSALAFTVFFSAPLAAENYVSHGYSMYGELKYGPDFTHFDYVDPEAPKGGQIRLGSVGTFDSLNPHILKGITPPRVATLIYDTLLGRAEDEVSTEYALLAESIEVPADLSWAIYALNPRARWHDGQPVTPEDVVFSFELLMSKG
ncbi:MAG: microcin C transport system substrate-binding protein, partial [Candidatus Latescibacterota bacterium]